jgi:hypothetical protein
MLELMPTGEGRAKIVRNKRGGVRLKVVIDSSLDGSYCRRCWININKGDEDCVYMCKNFELVTGTRKFWFERDED